MQALRRPSRNQTVRYTRSTNAFASRGGHQVDEEIYRDSALYSWLGEQRCSKCGAVVAAHSLDIPGGLLAKIRDVKTALGTLPSKSAWKLIHELASAVRVPVDDPTWRAFHMPHHSMNHSHHHHTLNHSLYHHLARSVA